MDTYTLFSEYQAIVEGLDSETWNQAEAWYSDAHNLCAWLSGRYNRPVSEVAAAMAVFSIRTSWSDNKKRLIRYLSTGEVRGTKLQLKKLREIERSNGIVKRIMKILSGDKIKRFFHNILFPRTSPFATVDSWMIKPLEIFGLTYGQLQTKGIYSETLYRRIERSIRLVAQSVNRPVPVVQAAIWIVLRGNSR